jgi:hypothetical protein
LPPPVENIHSFVSLFFFVSFLRSLFFSIYHKFLTELNGGLHSVGGEEV